MLREKTLFYGLRVLAIFTLTLFAASASAADHESVLRSFGSGTDAAELASPLVFDSAGNLYGTSNEGGLYNNCILSSSCGTVFELSPREGGGWTETVLHSFGNGTDGKNPYYSPLVLDAAGNLYGTTEGGGIHNAGTVFELSPKEGGGWKETILHSFGSNRDGAYPFGGVIFDDAGNLYGTTKEGGIHSCGFFVNCGTVFELSPTPGGGWTETVLHSFNATDGEAPIRNLVFDRSGNLYGTTVGGGVHDVCAPGNTGCGTVFELSPTLGGGWTETVLHNFGSGNDGTLPDSGLIFDSAGNLYGTTQEGGLHSSGTVFELSPRIGGGWTERVLHSLGNGNDGSLPRGNLIMDAAGNLYGTAEYGGIHDNGVAYELSPEEGGGWHETVMHSFGDNGTDGFQPLAGLIFDAAGNLYGSTNFGGIHGFGTVYEITP